MKLIEHEILNRALTALQGKFDYFSNMATLINGINSGSFNAVVRIMNIDFVCEIRDSVTTSSFNSILKTLQTKAKNEIRPVVLIARYINPNLLNEFVACNINVLDSAGNFHIRYIKEGHIIFQLSNTGEKTATLKEKNYPAFLETGIKVIFYLLNDLANINRSYREIKEATGVSLGSIKNVINELITLHYVLVTEKGRYLKKHRQLLEQWTISYNQILKPKLLLGRMSFRSREHQIRWSEMELPEGMYWGGENGAQMIDNYLEPGSFDIYTDIPIATLMRTSFVKQDENGEIGIYRKFWNWNTGNKIVPLILIYADLMGSGNARCLEIAQRLLDNGLKPFK